MDTWVLTRDDIGQVLNAYGVDKFMNYMIDTLEQGFAELGHGSRTGSPPRSGFSRSGEIPGIIETMPHRESGRSVTIKTVSYSPRNIIDHQLPTILATIARVDDDTGRLVSLCDGVLLTAVRTGAASALATKLLAKPGSQTVGLIGTGAQAVTQLHGLNQVIDIRRVIVTDINPRHTASFADRVALLGLPIEVTDVATVLRESDVICTATSVGVGEGPVFTDGEHRPHLHINSVGADEVGKFELPVSLLRRAVVCFDHHEQARHEGECQQLNDDEMGPSLAHLCAHPHEAAIHQDELTVFDSTGVAMEDHLALDVLFEMANELGLGSRLPIEGRPSDLLDPYSLAGLAR
ncbi:ornithine cyclodeaminase family protein [Austwickia chelonae]|uniref:ornithine cyclodeaminase family protein n=1 Tax=Austwickia chelonae TaxID=100225 RepID=UPI001966D4CC|nr:ornithine cyclodeaminase family protein [Austwickia chelonae]